MFIRNEKVSKSFIEIPLTQSFIEARISDRKVKYNYGSFHFKEKTKSKCNKTVFKSISLKGEKIVLKGSATGRKCSCNFSLSFTQITERQIEFNLTIEDSGFNEIEFSYLSTQDEHFFGFGEQPSHLDMKGKKPFIWCEEQGIGRGDAPVTFFANFAGAGGNEFTSYAPIPFYISTKNRAVFIENSTYISYDFKKDKKASVTTWDNQLHGTIWVADTPLELIELYTKKTGRFPDLPDWAYGTWMGLQGGSNRVKKIINEAKKAGNPVTALWIQDWVGRRKTNFGSQLWWRWEPDETTYPNFRSFVRQMKLSGVKVLGYINPFLANKGAMMEEAKANGYLVKDQRGEDYKVESPGFPAYMLDLTNPATGVWIKNIIKENMIGYGLSGWMADYAEWLPLDAQLHSGISPKKYHNIYPVDWARINREAIREAGKEGQILFFNRSGYSYSNKYSTLFWAGDQMVNWKKNDGLPSAITSLLSGGMSGISLNHSDIGGYTSVKKILRIRRTQKLLFRWSELNAFTPIFRTHEGLLPDFNAQVYSDEASVKFFARMGRLHYALKPYFQHYVKEASDLGYPVIRSLYLHYPDDPETYDLKYQFLVGEELLVIPVIKKRAGWVKGYFPEGNWQHAWSDMVIQGPGFKRIKAPMGQPAVFYKVDGAWEEDLKKVFQEFEK